MIGPFPRTTLLITSFFLSAAQNAPDPALVPLGPDADACTLIQVDHTSHASALLMETPSDTRVPNPAPVSRLAQALTIWNGAVFLTMALLVVRVIMARAPAVTTVDTEDMSISKQLPSVLLWGGLGIALICFNKYLYMPKEQGGFGFPCPLSLTWWHMFTGLVATNIVRVLFPDLMPAVNERRLDLYGFCTCAVPIGIVFSAYVAIGNSAYLYLSVSFVQMLKSAGPMCVYAMSVACGMERLTASSVMAICVVVVGVTGASVGELAFSWFGFALQFAAFILDGVRLMLFKMLVSSRGAALDPLSGLYYYSPVCVITLIWPVVHFEGSILWKTFTNAPPSLFGIIVLNGMLAFSLNLSFLRVLATASATTASLASVVRDICLTFGGALLFHSTITRVQVLGYLSACLGVKLWDETKSRPEAFYKAFGMTTSEQLPVAQK